MAWRDQPWWKVDHITDVVYEFVGDEGFGGADSDNMAGKKLEKATAQSLHTGAPDCKHSGTVLAARLLQQKAAKDVDRQKMVSLQAGVDAFWECWASSSLPSTH